MKIALKKDQKRGKTLKSRNLYNKNDDKVNINELETFEEVSFVSDDQEQDALKLDTTENTFDTDQAADPLADMSGLRLV